MWYNKNMEKSHNLTKILLPYTQKRLWVALSPDRKKVVGSGKTPKEAFEEAKEKKVERPTLLQAIPDYSGFVPFIK
jgi:hypothetical protein